MRIHTTGWGTPPRPALALALMLALALALAPCPRQAAASAASASMPRTPPVPGPSWPGYAVTRAVAACAAPHCAGFVARIVADYQWDPRLRREYLARGVLHCTIEVLSDLRAQAT